MPPWIPNAISVVRIGLVPVWLVLAFDLRSAALSVRSSDRTMLVATFIVLGASDLLDGFLARRFGLTSNFGATLDAVADKLAQVVSVTFLVFLGEPGFTPLPWWLWLALVVRDGALAIGWVLVYRRHRVVRVEHKWHGKVSSLVLFVVILLASAAAPRWLVEAGAIASLLFIVPGSVAYVREGVRQLQET